MNDNDQNNVHDRPESRSCLGNEFYQETQMSFASWDCEIKNHMEVSCLGGLRAMFCSEVTQAGGAHTP